MPERACDQGRAAESGHRRSATVSGVTVLQTVLVFVGIPVAIYAVIALLTLRDRKAKAPRYRPGQSWDFAPVWWSANPVGVTQGRAVAELEAGAHSDNGSSASSDSASSTRTAWGGARANW